MTEQVSNDKDERAAALQIAERWKYRVPDRMKDTVSGAIFEEMGILSRALLSAIRPELTDTSDNPNAAGQVPDLPVKDASKPSQDGRTTPAHAAPTPRTDALKAEFPFNAGADYIFDHARQLERELAEAQDSLRMAQGFGAALDCTRDAVSAKQPIQAHSKTQFKRLTAQGANVLPPVSTTQERNGEWWCPQCKEALPWNRVTFHERCDTCGTPVHVAGEGEVARLERDLAAANRSLDWCGEQLKACSQYVKDGETVPQAMERNWQDSQNALGFFAKERLSKEAFVAALKRLYDAFPDCDGGEMGEACKQARAVLSAIGTTREGK